MQQNTQKQTPQLNQPIFDGMETIHAKGEGGAAAASLDLGTLKHQPSKTPPLNPLPLSPFMQDLRDLAIDYGMQDEGGSTGRNWTIVRYLDGTIEVIGLHTTEGLKKPKPGVKKKRAKNRSELGMGSVERSVRRTKKTVRVLTKQLQPDHLLTFTTRKSIVESEVFKRITARFFRVAKEKGVLSDYVSVFERHMSEKSSVAKYGSLHLHVAIRGFADYNQLRKMWRDAVQWELKDGDYEGANIDGQRKRGHLGGNSIARYISKYITKDMDDEYYEPNKKRYWASKGIQKPEKIRLFSVPATHVETFRAMWEEIIGLELPKVFQPDRVGAQPPLIWMSTG